MPRLCYGCCLLGRKRKSFPIHEKQREIEVTKVFVRHVENIRLTPPPTNKKTISKTTMKDKPQKERNTADSQVPTSKLFRTSKQLHSPSPLPITISDIHERSYVTAELSRLSSINSDSPEQKKNSKHRSYVERYEPTKENSASKKTVIQPKKSSNGSRSPAKSKLVLENVRKMIQDQTIQQHFNHIQQKESARL